MWDNAVGVQNTSSVYHDFVESRLNPLLEDSTVEHLFAHILRHLRGMAYDPALDPAFDIFIFDAMVSTVRLIPMPSTLPRSKRKTQLCDVVR